MLNRLMMQWHALAAELAHPAIELTPEEFAVVLTLFKQMQAAGATFDPVFCALMDLLEAQVRGGDEDADADLCAFETDGEIDLVAA